MSNTTPVRIIVDDRIRLMAAALSITKYPESSQMSKRYHPHAHARATIKYLQDHTLHAHPAVLVMQSMLDNGAPLEALFRLALVLEWPGLQANELPSWVPDGWTDQLWDFYEKADFGSYWAAAKSPWEAAETQARRAFTQVYFQEFLEQFVGSLDAEFVLMPNISYPADREIGVRLPQQMIAIIPPPLAWGESPPWPFDEESMLPQHTHRAALAAYASLCMQAYLRNHADAVSEAAESELPVSEQMRAMYPTWEQQFLHLFTTAAVAIYLDSYVSSAESRGYILMEKKVHNMSILPGAVNVFNRFLNEKGNRFDSMAEYLSVFPKHLRVAKRIATI